MRVIVIGATGRIGGIRANAVAPPCVRETLEPAAFHMKLER